MLCNFHLKIHQGTVNLLWVFFNDINICKLHGLHFIFMKTVYICYCNILLKLHVTRKSLLGNGPYLILKSPSKSHQNITSNIWRLVDAIPFHYVKLLSLSLSTHSLNGTLCFIYKFHCSYSIYLYGELLYAWQNHYF